jgi:hypothetical protein
MKLIRYRRPSVNTLLGVTQEKRRIKRELGISQLQAWTKPSRIKQRAKYSVGYYSPTMRIIRQTSKGKFPSLLGMFSKKR